MNQENERRELSLICNPYPNTLYEYSEKKLKANLNWEQVTDI